MHALFKAVLFGASIFLVGCSSNAQEGKPPYVSIGQLFKAHLAKRPLSPSESSYLLGAAHGVTAYATHQMVLTGRQEYVFVCRPGPSEITAAWLHQTMVQDVIENNALISNQDLDASIVVAYTLSKHFPCEEGRQFDANWLEFTSSK
jgi:hypothetical protein